MIRAVMFDVYGTLLRSTAGGVHPDPEIRRLIAEEHARSPHPFPEVDIREIHARLHPEKSPAEIEALAMEHERYVNPVTAMPGAREALECLAKQGVVIGLISNAQFYTVPELERCLGASLPEAGIDPRLCVFSYTERRGKPDRHLFDRAAELLRMHHGISAEEALMVGNDVRNDILPAAAAGFRTLLFTGDPASLRLRERTAKNCGADLLVEDLPDLADHLDGLPRSDGSLV